MSSWIPAWIFVFAAGVLVAIATNRAQWRNYLGEAVLMLVVLIVSDYMVLYR